MKLLFVFLLFSSVCLSQGKTYTTVQIDSIAQVNGKASIAEGKTTSEKRIKSTKSTENESVIKGNGGFSITTYLNYYNKGYFEKLSREEKKKYNGQKDSELVKADYNQTLLYEDKNGETIYGQFYYRNNTLFYAKVKYTLIKPGWQESQDFDLDDAKLADPKPIKNILLFDVKSWISEKNKEILEHYKP